MGWLQKLLGRHEGVTSQEASRLVDEGALLVDVREPEEWRAGHVPGALHVPLGDVQGQLTRLPRERRLIVVCRSGHRSSRATALLLRHDFDAVNLDGGMRAWATAGLPVVSESGRPGRIV